MLDRLERTPDMREFMLPAGWEAQKRRIQEAYGTKPSGVRHVRGPVTLAMSVFGVENLIFLCLDEPELAQRFSLAIAEAGFTPGQAPGGFSFADDNCCLATPEIYEIFAYPILKRVFERYSPLPGDKRYQHSDSAMGHLLPILGRLDFNGVNFGPTVMADEIRRHMPRARIDGCIAPFTFMRNDEKGLVTEVRRDCDRIRATGTRGLNIGTAGSINNGSLLSSMRLVMAAIQEYGRY
jgi:uroporphyrinogen decarboxylase